MTEFDKAKAWRQRQGLSRRELGELTGFSERSIFQFEAGKRSDGTPIQADAMQRYRLCCAAIQHGHNKHFDWQ